MKRLFHKEYETYTNEAVIISKEIGVEIRKLIEKFCNENDYSINEIQYILFDEVSLNCAEFKLLRNIKFTKEKRNNDLK